MKAEEYYKNKDGQHVDDVKKLIDNELLSGWEEYYWAGVYINEYMPDATYVEKIINTLEESFFEGLSYLINKECYLNAIKILGRLYLETQRYDLAINMFQMLILQNADVPCWVHLRYAYAQLHADTAKRLFDEPNYFFERIEKIDLSDKANVEQRNAIYQEYLEQITKYICDSTIEIDVNYLFDKAAEYGILNTDAWKKFACEFPDVFGEQFNDADKDADIDDIEEAILIQEHLSKESANIIYGFFCQLFDEYKELILDDKRIQGLASDILVKNIKEKNMVKLAAMEGAISILSRSIEENENSQKAAFINSSKLLVQNCGFGENIASDFCIQICKAFKFTISFEEYESHSCKEIVSSFSDSLAVELEKENKRLLEQMHELQNQMADLILKNQDFENLLEEKKKIIDKLTSNEACIDNIAKSESNGIIYGHDLLDGNKKILVIGQPVVSVDKLLGIVKNYGYDKKDFVFWSDYDKIKSYAERMVGGSFTGIIAGPMPHKVTGLGDNSSLIEKMKQPGYPHMEEARNESGELKITKSSFRKALEGMTQHLLAIQ